MKYDDAAWHYGGDFPADLPPAAGATHIGLFAVWMQLNGHGSALHADGLEGLRRRAVNPAVWFLQNCDEKLTDADLSEEGNRFAERYYLHDEERIEEGEPSYLVDYMGRFPDADGAYSVADDWDSYDRLAPILTHRFALWRGVEQSRG
ncbi:DUF7832 domain-containing protein [Sandaracinobacteroides hominis]|uniref:DUF7832 domain-containing protein n=1 Tax=Sandaracinobacteroides hominis TaxID=2780086 RepID=UPI0018F44CB0|nr:hypothetical protein [Sandaracinobacteroides hominis]